MPAVHHPGYSLQPVPGMRLGCDGIHGPFRCTLVSAVKRTPDAWTFTVTCDEDCSHGRKGQTLTVAGSICAPIANFNFTRQTWTPVEWR